MTHRLLTILHISDLHFGEPAGASGDAALTARVKDWWGVHQIFEGYLGHSGVALRELDVAFTRLVQQESATLVVTGDVSSIGAPGEFKAATDFITGNLSISPGSTFGLNDTRAFDRTISGNHDHWPGTGGLWPMYGRETATFLSTFRRPLWPLACTPISRQL